ncbi:hypothetical protein A7D21_29395 [Pseudomonas sp. AP19]|uniref:hypothetical protein n=1 Tax=Pseudomonas TaxID=286 RepID=UPI00084B629E|nr:hypothetical protein [Pseudomonas sp. AP19]OEC70906.1 hypothetical protein A7D21_29395 [Pseudomonas sp. AP19]
MTPKDYVASMKANASRRVYTEIDIPSAVTTACQTVGLKLSDLLTELNEKDWAEFLVSYLKPRLHPVLISLLESDTVAIGTIDSPFPDASITSMENGYAILFSTGMREFVYRLARIIATRFSIADQSVEVELHETARLVAEVFWWFQETNVAHGADYAINEAQRQVANNLAMEAESFLLCHEIGHIASDTPGILEELSDDLPGVDRVEHLDEFIADFFGTMFVLGTREDDQSSADAIALQFRYAGIEFVLQIYQCLEKIGIDFSDSHPPAAERLAFIRNAIHRRCADEESWLGLSTIAGGIEGIFDNILAILDSPQEHAQYYERKAAELLDDLNSALRECSGGMVPDYVSFHPLAGKIFARGYPEFVIERVAQVAADFFVDVYAEDQEDAGDSSEQWIRLQQFKLLLSFVQKMPEGAVKERFMAALGCPVE